MAWSFAGALGSSLLGAISNSASAKKQYKYQSRLQEQAARLNYEYGIKSLQNSPTAEREGLETAGYNPMLAVQNSTSGANAGWTSAGQAQSQDIAGSIANALDIKRVNNETKTAESTVNLQNEQANTEQAKRENLAFQNSMLDVEKHLKQKDLDNYDKRFYTEMYRMMQEAEKLRQEASVVGYNAESNRIIANAQKLSSQTSQQHYNVIDAKTARYNEWADKHPYLSSISETFERHPRLHDYFSNYQKYKYDDNLRSKYDYDSESVIHYDKNGRERSSTKRTKHKRRY